MYFHESPEFQKLRVIDIGNRTSETEYIDFLEWDDLRSPVMRGVDCHSRPFITFRLGLQIVKEDGSEKMRYFVQTFFQRYSNYPENWVGGSTHGVLGTEPRLENHHFEMIRRLASGEVVEVDERHGIRGKLPTSRYYLATYDHWSKNGKTKTETLTL